MLQVKGNYDKDRADRADSMTDFSFDSRLTKKELARRLSLSRQVHNLLAKKFDVIQISNKTGLKPHLVGWIKQHPEWTIDYSLEPKNKRFSRKQSIPDLIALAGILFQ